MIVITRHAALVDLLIERGTVPADAEVHATATPDLIRDQHVVGVLPLHLAALCERVTVVPIDYADARIERGKEIPLEVLREVAGPAETYTVRLEVAGERD